jgi:hypothetical protein
MFVAKVDSVQGVGFVHLFVRNGWTVRVMRQIREAKKKEIKRQDNADSPGLSGTTKDVCNFEQ